MGMRGFLKGVWAFCRYVFVPQRRRLNMEEVDLKYRLEQFLETEARSGAMDFGCVTPFYVYRAWGGSVAIDEIASGLTELRKQGFMIG